jgi:hypothetical protein
VCRVEVTEQGSRLHHRVRNERTDVLSHELDLLDADDRRAVLAALPALERLAEALLERAAPPGPPAPPAIAAGKERNER